MKKTTVKHDYNIFGRKTTKIAFNSFYITKPAFLMSRTINI